MPTNDTGAVMDVPDDTIRLTPREGGLQFGYRFVTDTHVLSLLIDDPRAGHFEILLTDALAAWAATHLFEMLEDLDGLRARWENR